MKLEQLENPNGLVVKLRTQHYPTRPSQHFIGVIASGTFLVLDSAGTSGEIQSSTSVLLATADVLDVWSGLREFYRTATPTTFLKPEPKPAA